MYKTVLFDLDGTLTDSGLGITRAVMYALERMGCQVPPRESLYKFIGPPLHSSFQKYCGMDEPTSVEAVRQFRVYYNETGILENQVYDGVAGLLERLHGHGLRLIVATSKPQAAAERVIGHFGLDKWISHVVGSTDDPRRNTKGKVIGYVLEHLGVDPETAVMVGDREHDVLGAAENGIPCAGITYGYGDRDELTQAGAVVVFDTPAELADWILEG